MMSARSAGSVAGASRPAANAPASAAASSARAASPVLFPDHGRSAGSGTTVEPAAATAFP